nr:uncharacterized protein LOC111418141 [Onthophagus taurus]
MFLAHKKISSEIFEIYAKLITDLFPSEIQTTYYTPRRNKKNPSGKLYDRYNNIKHITKRLKPTQDNEDVDNGTTNVYNVEDEIEYYTAFLLSNSDPDLWDKVKDYWQRTANYRLKLLRSPVNSLNTILKEWPKYNDSKGYELINIDFDNIYKGKGSLLLDNFNNFVKLILPIYSRDIRDKLNKEHLEQLQKNTELSKDSRDYLIILLLHAILQPRRINRTHKPTILDSQDDFVLHVKTINDVLPKIEAVRANYRDKKIKLQPRIVVVGVDKNKLEDFYVYSDSIRYKFNSFIECLDITIKLIHVFNLEFSQNSRLVWLFLSRYFFGISDESITVVDSLVGHLNIENSN